MSIEELLQPRYKVIADYPGNVWEVGAVLPTEFSAIKILTTEMIAFYDKYPHLYKPLEWWEEREPDDMPQYVSYQFLETSEPRIVRVKKHFWNSMSEPNKYGFIDSKHDYRSYSKTKPATESDYLTYKSISTQK